MAIRYLCDWHLCHLWVKDLSNLVPIGPRLCGTHISEIAGLIFTIRSYVKRVWTCTCTTLGSIAHLIYMGHSIPFDTYGPAHGPEYNISLKLCLTDFHRSQFYGIVTTCNRATLWPFGHLTHMDHGCPVQISMALSRPVVVQRHGHLPIWLIRAYPWAKQFPTYGPNNELSILVSMGLGVLSFSERIV